MPDIHPFLWFDDQAMEAAEFYVSVFPSSRITDVVRYNDAGPGTPGEVMTVAFELDGKKFTAINGGPAHYDFNLGVSFVIDCDSAKELDHYWDALTAGGEESACGWLKDRFGLAWQVVPTGLPAVLGDPDPARAERAMSAMLGMKKLDLPAIAAAAQVAGIEGRAATARWVDAPAERIFDLLADPSRHPSVDGSGMLRSSKCRTLAGVGDEFVVNMYNDEMGDYVMTNRVVEYEPLRRIEWEPRMVEAANKELQARVSAPAHHRWGYALIPTGPGSTVVVEVFDCTRSPAWLRAATQEGEGWRPAMEASLDKLTAALA